MAKRIIYLYEGDMVEFRFVPKDEPKTFRTWDSLVRRSQMTLRLWYNQVAPTGPYVHFNLSNEAWK